MVIRTRTFPQNGDMSVKKIKQNVIRFLRKYQMDHLDIDFDTNINVFLTDMQRGLAGKKSSLEMIPTYSNQPASFRQLQQFVSSHCFHTSTLPKSDQNTEKLWNIFPLFRINQIYRL